MLRHRVFQVAAVLAACAMSACENPMREAATVAVTGIKVSPQVLQLVAVGDTARITATIVPANATDRAIMWESTDSSVATVDIAGLVTAHAAGAGVFVTAITHDGQYQASVNVTVTVP